VPFLYTSATKRIEDATVTISIAVSLIIPPLVLSGRNSSMRLNVEFLTVGSIVALVGAKLTVGTSDGAFVTVGAEDVDGVDVGFIDTVGLAETDGAPVGFAEVLGVDDGSMVGASLGRAVDVGASDGRLELVG